MQILKLEDDQLIETLQDSMIFEREQLVDQLDLINELERRKLYLNYTSLWALLVHEFNMEEWTSETRILVARLMRKIPEIREGLLSGKLNLSKVLMAQACARREKLSDSELLALLDSIGGMSCRMARREIASQHPRYRELQPDRIRPIDDDHSEIRCTVPNEFIEKLESVKDLLAHRFPTIILAELFNEMASDYLERHHPRQKAERAGVSRLPISEQVERRSPTQSMKHELVRTQGYRCSYVDPKTGKACHSEHALEIDHEISWVRNGKTELKNLRFLCRAHHARKTFVEFS